MLSNFKLKHLTSSYIPSSITLTCLNLNFAVSYSLNSIIISYFKFEQLTELYIYIYIYIFFKIFFLKEIK